MLEFLDHELIQGNTDDEGGNTNGKEQKKDVFFQFRSELFLDIVQGEIGDKDSGDLLLRFMAGETFLPIINWVDISEDLLSLERGVNNCLIKRLRGPMVADLACRITEFDDSSYLLIVNGSDDSANPVEDEDFLDIWVLARHLQDVFHFPFVLDNIELFKTSLPFESDEADFSCRLRIIFSRCWKY
jgi:hypothetical protein